MWTPYPWAGSDEASYITGTQDGFKQGDTFTIICSRAISRVILSEQNMALREHTGTRVRPVDKCYLYVCTVSDGHRAPTTATPGDTCSPIDEPYTAPVDSP